MGRSIDPVQPLSGKIEPRPVPARFHIIRTLRHASLFGINPYQTYLNRMRKKFLEVLSREHVLFTRVDQDTGKLKEVQPDPGERKVFTEAELIIKRRKQLVKKYRDEIWKYYFLRPRFNSREGREGLAMERQQLALFKARIDFNKKYEERQAEKKKWEQLYVERRKLENARVERPANEETKALDEEEERLHWKLFGMSGKNLQGPRLPAISTAARSLAALQAADETRRSRREFKMVIE